MTVIKASYLEEDKEDVPLDANIFSYLSNKAMITQEEEDEFDENTNLLASFLEEHSKISANKRKNISIKAIRILLIILALIILVGLIVGLSLLFSIYKKYLPWESKKTSNEHNVAKLPYKLGYLIDYNDFETNRIYRNNKYDKNYVKALPKLEASIDNLISMGFNRIYIKNFIHSLLYPDECERFKIAIKDISLKVELNLVFDNSDDEFDCFKSTVSKYGKFISGFLIENTNSLEDGPLIKYLSKMKQPCSAYYDAEIVLTNNSYCHDIVYSNNMVMPKGDNAQNFDYKNMVYKYDRTMLHNFTTLKHFLTMEDIYNDKDEFPYSNNIEQATGTSDYNSLLSSMILLSSMMSGPSIYTDIFTTDQLMGIETIDSRYYRLFLNINSYRSEYPEIGHNKKFILRSINCEEKMDNCYLVWSYEDLEFKYSVNYKIINKINNNSLELNVNDLDDFDEIDIDSKDNLDTFESLSSNFDGTNINRINNFDDELDKPPSKLNEIEINSIDNLNAIPRYTDMRDRISTDGLYGGIDFVPSVFDYIYLNKSGNSDDFSKLVKLDKKDKFDSSKSDYSAKNINVIQDPDKFDSFASDYEDKIINGIHNIDKFDRLSSDYEANSINGIDNINNFDELDIKNIKRMDNLFEIILRILSNKKRNNAIYANEQNTNDDKNYNISLKDRKKINDLVFAYHNNQIINKDIIKKKIQNSDEIVVQDSQIRTKFHRENKLEYTTENDSRNSSEDILFVFSIGISKVYFEINELMNMEGFKEYDKSTIFKIVLSNSEQLLGYTLAASDSLYLESQNSFVLLPEKYKKP